MPARRTAILAVVLALAAACQTEDDRAATGRGVASDAMRDARSDRRMPADNGQWTTAAKDLAGTRFTSLADITTGNVSRLTVAWTFSTGLVRGHEAAPLVVGDTMYVVTPFPNRLYALDLTRSGATKWMYDPKPDASSQGVACCDVVNRGAVYWNGRIYYATLDNHAVAVDAETGAEVWKQKLGDINRGETMTMAPIAVKGKILFGNSGGEMGVRGWIAALDAESGETVWRAYSTGPDRDVLIGPSFHPYYLQDRGKDLGIKTWPPDKWRIGGGTVWGWLSYDPELDLLFYGTANPGPWNSDQRPGDNKWTAGIFARRPATGEAVWFYQWSPHDLWDYDGVNESILVDLVIGGARKKVLLHPDRNGYLYVLDAASGQVLSADPYVHITTSNGVDLETGRLIENPEKHPKVGVVVRDVCPFAAGGKDWQPSAWSPQTGLLYIPHNNMCMDWESTEVGYIAGTPYVGANTRMYAGPGGQRGAFTAWDPAARKKVWSVPESFPVWSGALVTAGGLVFYGTMEGNFKALDARTGRELWRFKLPSGVIGQPVSYRGPDGKQYVAILSGVGGWAGAGIVGQLDPRDATAANGFVAALADLKKATERGGALFVFSL
jgi:PQQ-dependent dehydrogenase (methanol/ethanol family)